EVNTKRKLLKTHISLAKMSFSSMAIWLSRSARQPSGLPACFRAQRHSITSFADPAIKVVAAIVVVDAVAVAHVEPFLRAVSPDRVLHEPREGLWQPAIEVPSVDLFGDDLNNVDAPPIPVASKAVEVIGIEPVQDACAN